MTCAGWPSSSKSRETLFSLRTVMLRRERDRDPDDTERHKEQVGGWISCWGTVDAGIRLTDRMMRMGAAAAALLASDAADCRLLTLAPV